MSYFLVRISVPVAAFVIVSVIALIAIANSH